MNNSGWIHILPQKWNWFDLPKYEERFFSSHYLPLLVFHHNENVYWSYFNHITHHRLLYLHFPVYPPLPSYHPHRRLTFTSTHSNGITFSSHCSQHSQSQASHHLSAHICIMLLNYGVAWNGTDYIYNKLSYDGAPQYLQTIQRFNSKLWIN